MKKRIFFFFLLSFLFLGNIVFSQSSDYYGAELDGYNWRDYSNNFKIGYVTGYCHALWVSSERTMLELSKGDALNESITYDGIKGFSQSMTKLLSPNGVNIERVVYELDELYRNSANKPIPVYTLIPLIGKLVRAELTQSEMEKELRAFRAEFSKMDSSSSRIYIPPDYSVQRKPEQYYSDRSYSFPGSRLYIHESTGFKVRLPENWRIDEIRGKDHFLEVWSPQESLLDDYSEYIMVTKINRKNDSVRDLHSQYRSQLESSLKNFKIISGKNTVINGKKAYIYVFSFLSRKGISKEIVIKACWIYDVNNLYVINCSAKSDEFKKFENLFDNVINSIEF